MNYKFQFGVVFDNLDALLQGAILTFVLGLSAFAGGLAVGAVCAAIRSHGPRPLRWLTTSYVVFFTNTPALIQIYVLYFGLPEVGIRWSAEACVLIGLILNAGAYLTLILGAGFLSVHRAEIEAAETLGLTTVQKVRYIILPHTARMVYPAIANFFVVLLVMGTSVGAVVGVDELTGQAINLSTVNYRWLEYFIAIAVIYVALTFLASVLLGVFGRRFFRVKAGVL